MPASKRLKDCMKAYPGLLEAYQAKKHARIQAQSEYLNAKKVVEDKLKEILAEMDSCIPQDPAKTPWERIFEFDGKHYVITHRPADMNADIPSYVREIQIER